MFIRLACFKVPSDQIHLHIAQGSFRHKYLFILVKKRWGYNNTLPEFDMFVVEKRVHR